MHDHEREASGVDAPLWFTGPPGDRRRYAVASEELIAPGQVFRGRSLDGDVEVSLKQLGAVDAAAEARERSRLARLADLRHPHLARTVEVFRGPGLFRGEPPPDDECDVLYWVAEWVPGASLWARRGDRDPALAATVVRDLAAALEPLHALSLAHGDVHPGNVVLAERGAVLIDLGSIVAVGADDASVATGVVGFVPPEMARGDNATPASDGWQLAMVVAQLLLGHPVGRGGDAELEDAIPGRRGSRLVGSLRKMLADDPIDRPADITGWADEVAALLASAPSRRRLYLAAGIVVTAAAVAGVAVTTSEDGGRPTVVQEVVAPPELDATVVGNGEGCRTRGSTAMVLSPEQRSRIEAAMAEVEARSEPVCHGVPERFVDAIVIPIQRSGEPDGVVVLSPDGESVALDAVQWQSYQQIAGRQRPENAADVGGYPTEVLTHDGGGYSIELSAGGVMVGALAGQQSFWIPEQLRGLWEEAGGASGEFGYPASNPYFSEAELAQDFEHVQVRTSADAVSLPPDEIVFTVLRPEDRGAPLDPFRPLAGRILRQPSGVAWHVDADGVRHWIPDGETYFCLGGDDALVPVDVPGHAVWTLPGGPPAACSG